VLQEIRIGGLGVIDEAVLRLHPGLTVLTGETGAGKTMVVQGLGLLLGARADSGLVRSGRPLAAVEGLAVVAPGHPARARAEEAGGVLDGDELVLARTVSTEGRSRGFVGGRSAPVGVLAELGESLVAVHGQADQWRLRRPDQHRDVLDAYGGARVAAVRTAYAQAYAGWRALVGERDRLRSLDRDRAREVDSLGAALEQIAAIDPRPGEDQALREEDSRLAHAEGLRSGVAEAHALVTGEDPSAEGGDLGAGIAELLVRARGALGPVARHDPWVDALDGRLAEAAYLLADLGADLAAYLADLEVDPARLAWVQQRRADLGALTRRYGETVDEVLAWSRDAAARLDLLITADERLTKLDAEVDAARGAVTELAAQLHSARVAAAERFRSAVATELAHLAMGSARVHVAVTSVEPGPDGADEVEIQLAANSGATPRSVAKVASGGELSRLMLAIEVVTASAAGEPATASVGQRARGASADPVAGPRPVPTFVFDEVDSGVGGAAAVDVGARLAALAAHAQVVVVTHLAQVAAFADRHLVVRKADDGTVTASAVGEVEGDARLRELARMMGGDTTREGLEHARVLLESATRMRTERPAPAASTAASTAASAAATAPATASTRHTRGAAHARRAEAHARADKGSSAMP